MSGDYFCGSRILSSALRERGKREGGGARTDTAPCNSKLQLTIAAVNVVEDHSYM